MRKDISTVESFLLLSTIVVILFFAIGATKNELVNCTSLIQLIGAYIPFAVPLLLVVITAIYLFYKNKVSGGYLASSAILAACAIRHLGEIVSSLFKGYSLHEFKTYLTLGILLLALSAYLLVVGAKKEARNTK